MPVDARPIKVMKFGGTSVGEPARLRSLVEIVRTATPSHRVVVTASALSGVTDMLVAAADALAAGLLDRTTLINRLRARHQTHAEAVLSAGARAVYDAALHEHLMKLILTLGKAEQDGLTPDLRDSILAAGERMAVPLVTIVLREVGLNAVPVDAADLIRTDATHGAARVDRAQTRTQIRLWHRRLEAHAVPVVTGFIGSTEAGATTTLGRGGSDYTAALLASALEAEVLERWTDVDGIYTDDPRVNEHAQRLAHIVLEEASAWNHAGRLGMHRQALDPLVEVGVPVHVRSTATPDKPGTWIVPAGHNVSALAS